MTSSKSDVFLRGPPANFLSRISFLDSHQTLSVNYLWGNDQKFGKVFRPPVTGVYFADQGQNDEFGNSNKLS